MKKSIQWLIVFFAVAAVGIAGFMAINFTIDPTGYFAVERNADEIDGNGYTRAAKTKYLKKHKGEYDGVIIGGSKAGVLSTERLSEYTGKRYYNFYISYGCFADYLTYIPYLAEETGVSEVTLHLSSIEVLEYDRSDTNEIYEVPAVVNGSTFDLLLENLDYLCRSINSTVEYAMQEKGEDQSSKMDSLTTGERNYAYPYAMMAEDPEGYVKKYVLTYYKDSMKNLFDGKNPSTPAIADNIQAFRQIKQYCEEHDVTMKVVIGPTFLTEMRKLEGEPYYEYLRELVQISDIWDFSGFLLENRNPYNFVNEGHYTNAVADLMVDTMYGKRQKEGFGILLTKDNIEEYLQNRRADFADLQEEYEQTGEIALPDKKDASYIG